MRFQFKSEWGQNYFSYQIIYIYVCVCVCVCVCVLIYLFIYGHTYLSFIYFDAYLLQLQSNSGTKAKEDLAAATHAVEVCSFSK